MSIWIHRVRLSSGWTSKVFNLTAICWKDKAFWHFNNNSGILIDGSHDRELNSDKIHNLHSVDESADRNCVWTHIIHHHTIFANVGLLLDIHDGDNLLAIFVFTNLDAEATGVHLGWHHDQWIEIKFSRGPFTNATVIVASLKPKHMTTLRVRILQENVLRVVSIFVTFTQKHVLGLAWLERVQFDVLRNINIDEAAIGHVDKSVEVELRFIVAHNRIDSEFTLWKT